VPKIDVFFSLVSVDMVQDMLGGVCVNTGTIPSKTLREGKNRKEAKKIMHFSLLELS
jgi:pyruvate/2-oxoglutarate dehydrogenase complex dihydrolipoamide dehydrogenase (E3) component